MSDHALALSQAISALYGGSGGEAQQQANQWLNSFSQQPQAWEACLELLDPGRDAEVCFFCANMLLTKVRKEWHKVPNEQQLRMAAVISDKLRAFLAVGAPAKLATQRLGLLLAAVASLSGPRAAADFAGQCAGMVAAGGGGDAAQAAAAECGLSMLSALAEEIANMDGQRRKDLVAATEPQWPHVVAAAQALAQQAPSTGSYGLLCGALQCLGAWLRLSPDGISPCRVSPGQLCAAHPELLGALTPLLAPPEPQRAAGADHAQQAAAELLSDLLGPGAFGTDPQQEAAALGAATSALLSLRAAALAPGPAGAAAARAAGSVAGALAERDAEAATAGPGALALAELMLQLVQRPEREVCQACVEYFLMLNTVPVAQRHPQLAAPLFGALAQPLLARCCYPPGFEGWEECVDEDEEAFTRFREQGASELLEAVYNMVGPPFLRGLADAAAAAPDWRQAEAALFALRAAGGPARRHALGGGDDPRGAAARGALGALFGELCAPGGGGAGAGAGAAGASPYARATAAELVGAYAPWFEAADAAPLDGALGLLLQGLGSPVSCRPAAAALRALCARCAGRLGRAPAAAGALAGLSGLAAAAVAPAPAPGAPAAPCGVPFEDRCAVVEGLSQVAAALPPPDAGPAAARLAAPHAARAAAVLAHGGGAAAAGGAAAGQQLVDILSEEIRLIAAIVRKLEIAPPPGRGPGGPLAAAAAAAAAAAGGGQQQPEAAAAQHPSLAVLEACWPLLGAVAESQLCRQQPAVVDAVCEVFNRALQTARGAAKPLLPTLLKSALDIFASTHHPACLLTLAAVAEAFGELRGDPSAAAAQRAALEGGVGAAAAALAARGAAGQGAAASGDLLRALVAAGDAHLVFAQRLLLGGGGDGGDGGDGDAAPVAPACLDALCEAAVQAAGLREKEPAAAAFGFLAHLISVINKAPADGGGAAAAAAPAAAAARALAPRGEALARALVLGVCDTAPRQLLRPLAGVLYALLTSPSLGPPGAAWLLAALQAPGLPGADAGLLQPADVEAFAKAALRRPSLPRGRFDALVMDFAAVPRGEGTGDALMAYEM
ncbi:MAG: armadillo-type protein [Monoraphidium minutum]|nr:MAG: armadillo-type protein [Monoraphidium minutum]